MVVSVVWPMRNRMRLNLLCMYLYSTAHEFSLNSQRHDMVTGGGWTTKLRLKQGQIVDIYDNLLSYVRGM